MANILVVPDCHVRPTVNQRRFVWLNKLVRERKPEYIVWLGDVFDFNSLCLHDKLKVDFLKRSYNDDCNAGAWAFSKAMEGYNGKTFFIEGNHENRIERVISEDSRFAPFLRETYERSIPKNVKKLIFPNGIEIEGVHFMHYAISGIHNRPTSGENPATALLNKAYLSCIVGHSHLYDYSERSRVDGKKIQALVAGCFLDEAQKEEYAGNAQKLWRNCITYLHNVKNGNFDFELISYERLKKEYA